MKSNKKGDTEMMLWILYYTLAYSEWEQEKATAGVFDSLEAAKSAPPVSLDWQKSEKVDGIWYASDAFANRWAICPVTLNTFVEPEYYQDPSAYPG